MNINRWVNNKFTAQFIFLIMGLALSQLASSQICSTDADIAIPLAPDATSFGTPVTIDIVVPSLYDNLIDDINFDLNIEHDWVGDLLVTLTSPAGTVVTLVDRPGVPASTYGCSRDDIDASLDDEAGTAVEGECAAATPTIDGSFSPNGSLSDFDGENPVGTWVLTASDFYFADTGTIISASNCLDLTTVPVVLSSFSSKQRGKHLLTKWQTSTEAFNLGFNVWGNIDGEWSQLNNKVIRSGAVDSIEPLNYRRSFKLNHLPSPPTEIGISSISSSGFEEFYGPFQIGDEYGEITVPKPINWSEQRKKHANAMHEAGYEFNNGRWRKTTAGSKSIAKRLEKRFADTWLRIEEDGVYRVSYEDLLDNGIDLNRLPIRRLALSHAGKAIARHIKGSTKRPMRFGPGAEIIFYAQTPKGDQSRYSSHTNIRISTDINLVLNAPVVRTGDESQAEPLSDTHLTRVNFGEPNGYSFIVPGDNPWYDQAVYAFGQIGIKKMEFELAENAIMTEPANIVINLMGGTSFDNVDADGDGDVEPDHHYKVYLNRETFPNPIYEGYSEKVDAVRIEAQANKQLISGTNTLELEVIPDNGHNLDAVYFLDANIQYRVQNNANMGNGLLLAEEQNWLSIEEQPTIKHVYLTDTAGNFSKIKGIRKQNTVAFKLPPSIGESVERKAWLANSTELLAPTAISTAPIIDSAELNLSNVDYVIVAATSLVGEDLDRYVQQQTDLGRRVKVVNTHDVYAQYSEGVETPTAIADYLRSAALGRSDASPSPFEYVLLVGGHTYNYLGHNVSDDERPINLIPSFYRNGKQTINRQIPTAVPFVDFDQDGTPDRAIGRWPVRDIEQLKLVVDKTITWHEAGSHKNNQQALLIAQKNEDLHNFSQTLERVNTKIGHATNQWLEPKRVFVSNILTDDSVPDDQKINEARARIVAAMNQGPALTVYSGHASPTTWGRENLLTTSVVDQFTNTSKPSLIVPLACYTTYYETPKVKSLSERLFTDNAAGAVGLSGPALLSYNSDNERFSKTLLRLMTQHGHDIGTATMMAKQAIKTGGERQQTVIYNWVTLADPTLNFGLPPIVEVAPIEESRE